jgi:hypothetical protein
MIDDHADLTAEWEREIGTLHSASDVAALLRLPTPAAVEEQERAGEILSVSMRNGETRYPGFQFAADGKLPCLGPLLAILDHGAIDSWTLAAWFVAADDELLEGQSPKQWLLSNRPKGPVATAARRFANSMSRRRAGTARQP